MTLDDLWGHTWFYENLCLHNDDILFKRLGEKYIGEKDDFEILNDLMRPLMTSEVLRYQNISILSNFYQNWLID